MYKLVHVFKYQVNKHSYMRTNFHEYVLTRTHICSFYHCIIEHTFEIFAKICYKNRTYVFLRTHYMSVYSYVVLKVHINVWKVGTHLNVCFINRTYVCRKYTFMFAYNNERSIYLYIMNIPLPRPFSTFSFLYYTIIYYIYIQKREYSFPHLTFPATFFPHLCLPLYSLLYTLYIDTGNTFPQLFPPIPLLLLYSSYI